MSNEDIHLLDVSLWGSMLLNGYKNLKRNMSVIDDLNVFPVPDGDTGKNMTMTFEGGVTATRFDYTHVCEMMNKFSRSSLLSARGNSGVILSQFIRGIAVGSENLESFDIPSFVSAFRSGVDYAYSAVSKPTEGTMLTVLREGAEYLESHSFSDFGNLFEELIAELKRSLKKTPELLAVLKEAGVVDSGGAGIVCIFEGMYAYLCGEEIDELDLEQTSSFVLDSNFNENSILEYGYCTEFILQLLNAKTDISAFNLTELTRKLETLGDSVVTVMDGSIVKVHVHTFSPETVIGYVRQFGELVTVKIENMSVQHSEVEANKPKEKSKFAVIATATGKGFADFFVGACVDVVIDGGATNNPSANDFIEAFDKVNAENIIVLPNDSNVVLTAHQAAELYSKAKVTVIDTKSLAEGYSAVSMMDLSVDTLEELISDMTMCLPDVTAGYVATANRDGVFGNVTVESGKWIGFCDDDILSCDSDPVNAAMALFESLQNINQKQVITSFYGKGVPQEEIERLSKEFSAKFPRIEIGFISGEQEVYRYVFAIE